MTKLNRIYLDRHHTYSPRLTSTFELRCILAEILQKNSHILISSPTKSILDPEIFLTNLKTHANVYQASLSRQFAADFPPSIEQTTLKDEPKDWYIKTADFGDECDRILQHRDGRYTQLLEDIATYHHLLQNHCDRVIILRPHDYGRYDVQVNAAMQCLGYTPAQFQFIIVQPIHLYAFHQPSQKLQRIPDLPLEELQKVVDMDTLRWHCFSSPLTKPAPINLSTVGQPTDSLYQLKAIYAQCCSLIESAYQQGIIDHNSALHESWNESEALKSLENLSWESPLEQQLVAQVQAVPELLDRCAELVSLEPLTAHLKSISQNCSQWFETLALTPQSCLLLLIMRSLILFFLKDLLNISIL
ncbi:hypothetical protein [Limnothrix redekei]|uniref:DALR anticodon binding domain-containing protein n=1 Tax=Limnothrix redekei LRLZ20PSL1 TaxID=3112953 RepID=A0ABW7CEM5_9CYAN